MLVADEFANPFAMTAEGVLATKAYLVGRRVR